MSELGVEVPCTITQWDEASLSEKSVVVDGALSGSTIVAGNTTVWVQPDEPPPPPPDVPSVPQNVKASNITGNSFTLTWDGSITPDGYPVEFYNVRLNGAWYTDVGEDGTVVTSLVEAGVGAKMSLDVTDLAEGTEYVVTIDAVNSVDASLESVPLRVVTLSPPPPDLAPNAPTDLQVPTVSQSEATVRWTASTLPAGALPVEEYYVYTGGTTIRATVLAPATSVTITGLSADRSYTFTVRAFNGLLSDASNSVTIRTLAEVVTPPPTEEPPPPTDGGGTVITVTGLPYTTGSFFKSRVDGSSVPIDGARTTAFRNFMATHIDQGAKGITWPKVNMNQDWAMSYYVHRSGGTAPVWKLAGGNTGDAKLKILQTQGFHMSDAIADTFPTGTQDRPGVMVDYQFGYTVQFADAVPNKATRTITVSNAAIMWHGSNGLDYRNPKSNDARNFTSRGRILDAMVIRRDILDQAVKNGTGLGHVLHIFFVETKSTDGFCHPMVGAESMKNGWGTQGERIRIKPSVSLTGRGLTGAALAVARTLQQNGGYLGDNSGSSTQIKASQASVYTGTNLTTDCLKGKVSWTDFEVVQRGWPG